MPARACDASMLAFAHDPATFVDGATQRFASARRRGAITCRLPNPIFNFVLNTTRINSDVVHSDGYEQTDLYCRVLSDTASPPVVITILFIEQEKQ